MPNLRTRPSTMSSRTSWKRSENHRPKSGDKYEQPAEVSGAGQHRPGRVQRVGPDRPDRGVPGKSVAGGEGVLWSPPWEENRVQTGVHGAQDGGARHGEGGVGGRGLQLPLLLLLHGAQGI